ncbi:MAG: PASTA domain-containing protein [Paludibacteraceae bacterium]|nr:PASTA domain-containing protein [Paludibacteraceae bacterium]
MSLPTVFNFLKSKFFWINVGVAILSVIVLTIIVLFSLKFFTKHGEQVAVPDVTGLYVEEADVLLKKQDLSYQVVDSVYVRDKLQGEILEQIPRAESNVKTGRIVYLTLNSKSDKMIILPQVQNVSYRQARATLEAIGFVVSNIEYKPSEFPDLVMGIRVGQTPVRAGDRLRAGASVVLIVGSQTQGETAVAPDLIGFTQSAAEQLILQNNFVVGSVDFDVPPTNEADKANYFVYRQSPEPTTSYELGRRINIWLTKDADKMSGKSSKETTEEDFF